MAEAAEQQWQPTYAEALESFNSLQAQAGERVAPLIENTRPIWSDPLWQFLALILLVVIALVIVFWVLRLLGGGLAAFAEGIKNILFSCVKSLFSRSNKQEITEEESKPDSQGKRGFWFDRARIKRSLDAIKYLTTRRDWRYQTSWYLLTGTDNSGKTDWIESVHRGRRSHLLIREKQLVDQGSGWHFFDHGLVIDTEDKNFSRAVELINAYRPERPLDGVILTVSAATLLSHQHDHNKLREYGQDLYQKMWEIQKVTGFILPVYMVVTECENIKGFNSFWSSWSDNQPDGEMFGWSNPARIDTAFSIQWVQDTFSYVIDAVRRAQLTIASGGEAIEDIDSFMLFDRELQSLQEPLTEVLKQAFSRSSFQEALPLRGIWFSGRIGDDVALSEDLFAEKIWPETHLAYPIAQRFFSANKILRNFQYFSVAAAILLTAGLVVDGYRMHRYTQQAESSWKSIFAEKSEAHYCSGEGLSTWWLLNNLTRLSDQPTTPTIISSWGGGQIPAIREATADHVYPGILFPAYECRLRIRAKELNDEIKKEIDKDAKTDFLITKFKDYTDRLSAYQQAQSRFIRLAGPLPDSKGVAKDLRLLTDYLYEGAIPSSVDFSAPLILGGVMDAHYDIEWSPNDLVDKGLQSDYIVEFSRVVKDKIQHDASTPPLNAIRHAFFLRPTSNSHDESVTLASPEEMLQSIEEFQEWLRYVTRDWLKANEDHNPCGALYGHLEDLQTTLGTAGYSKADLNTVVDRFSPEHCHLVVRHHLKTLNAPPFGQLFVQDDSGTLVFSSELHDWINEFNALESLNLLAYAKIEEKRLLDKGQQRRTGKITAWDTAPLSEAIDIMLSFQAFRQQWWVTSGARGEPFYASALRARLHRVIKQLIFEAQIRDFTPTSNGVSIVNDLESSLSASVVTFERASGLLRQLETLIQQEKGGDNATILRNTTRDYIHNQLEDLTYLVKQNRLYQPLTRVDRNSDNIAQALFSYDDPKALASYLENQRQRLNYLAQSYARPLVSYLIDTDSIAETRNDARIWYSTLLELRQYDRQQPGNEITLLENYVSEQLHKQSWQDCQSILDQPQAMSSGGLFSQRFYAIDRQVRIECKDHGKNQVIRQYLALAERFNRDLKGQFPFAKYSEKGNDVRPAILGRFIDDYENIWVSPKTGPSLKSALTEYLDNNPGSGLDQWLVFVKNLDKFVNFYHATNAKDGVFTMNVDVGFNARSGASKGQDQIVEWRLLSSGQQASFPNGNDQISWTTGDDLLLSLRWAHGSEFTPLRSFKAPQQVNLQQGIATFQSNSRWSVFEWLQRFGQPQKTTRRKNWLEFSVPVGLKQDGLSKANQSNKKKVDKKKSDKQNDATANPQTPAYTSRLGLTLSVVVTEENGREKHISIPAALPQFAPGLPGDIDSGGKL